MYHVSKNIDLRLDTALATLRGFKQHPGLEGLGV